MKPTDVLTQKVIDICEEKGIRILLKDEDEFPERLRQIASCPDVLFVRGTLPDIDNQLLLALVGTRHCSTYGIKMARQLSTDLVERGAIVVTGLAKGIDAEVAKSALNAGGIVVGVLGTAIDVDYPKENKELIREVESRGCLISELPPTYPTLRSNFPRRNRIISGISNGTVIVEAPEKSGALITANLAIEQGRDLFVCPANADSAVAKGSNQLLQSCGKAVMSAEDILVEYKDSFEIQEKPKKSSSTQKVHKNCVDKAKTVPYIDLKVRLESFSETQQKILSSLIDGEKNTDQIVVDTGLTAAAVLPELTMLSISGAVKPLPGNRYKLTL